MKIFNAIIVLSISLVSCTESKKPSEKSLERIEKKNGPFDHFYFQRAFPDDQINFEAMERSLKEAKAFAQSSSKSSDGEWTEIGPYNLGGRINCIAIHPDNDNIILSGTAGGGVFRTEDGGNTWTPLTDDLTHLPIGHIVFDPVDPSIIYVGTGDPNIGGTVWVGNGIYKSTDSGETWTYLGLEECKIISKIAVNPLNTDQIFAATMGVPFERNNDRGLYRSNDGGLSWEQILFVNDESGIIDLAMNPENPNVIYAANWNRIRTNLESVASGPDAAIYKTIDGGDTWTPLSNGLPTGEMSRIGLKIWEGDPNVVFTQYVGTDFQLHGIYKSVDAGENFTEVNTTGINEGALGGFGWYFAKIGVSPYDQNEISLLGIDLYTTFDGGDNWSMTTPEWWQYEVHADKHAIEYLGPDEILLATDGGLYRTTDGYQTWSDIDQIPNTQFYRITSSPHFPGMILAGAQDNGTAIGNATDPQEDWLRLWGGDGFTSIADPVINQLYYAGSQFGNFVAIFTDIETNFDYISLTDGINASERVNWDAPLIMDPLNHTQLYTGTERVYKMSDAPWGIWEPISPVLVNSDPTFFTRRNISTVAKSGLEPELIYAGTSDGQVWVSQNDGGSWAAINASLPEYYVTDIKTCPFQDGRVFVTFSGYRDNDNTPHMYRSDDYGATWTGISGDLPEMPVNHIEIYTLNTWFIATDNGVYITTNGGENWERLGSNMPYVVVLDLHIDPLQNALIAATFARSALMFDLDNIFVSTATPPPAQTALNLYPNPASDFMTVETPGKQVQSYRIFSPRGTVVSEKQKNNTAGESFQINLTSMAAGVYFIVTYDVKGERLATERFIISR